MSEEFDDLSPYNYAFNNPIRFIDPDGRQGTDWFKDKQGDYIVICFGYHNGENCCKKIIE